jgi:hypothetical protein
MSAAKIYDRYDRATLVFYVAGLIADKVPDRKEAMAVVDALGKAVAAVYENPRRKKVAHQRRTR